MHILIIRIILFIIFILLIYFLLILMKSIKRERRISRYSLKMNNNEDESIFDSIINKYNKIVEKIEKSKSSSNDKNKSNKHLLYKDMTPTRFMITKLLIGIIFTILMVISQALKGKFISFLGFIITFIIGYFIYDIFLIIKNKHQKQRIKNEMLRAVIIMNNAFKVGKSILQATLIASKDLPYPINLEFKKIYQDMSYGLSADVAFSRFAKRVNLEEATYISTSLTILNKTGGNIVSVFSSIEKTLFDKKKLESDLKNSTAASNLVVKVLMFVPFLFALIIYIISPDYFSPLFSSPLGYMVLFIIIIMSSIYTYLLKKIMKVEV